MLRKLANVFDGGGRMMQKKWLMSALIVGAGIGLFAGSSMAGSIQGGLDLTGTLTLTGGTSFATATTVDFLDVSGGQNRNKAEVDLAYGDLASLEDQVADMNDFVFAPNYAASNPLWTVGGFRFDMQSINVTLHDSLFLHITGDGILQGNGYDATAGTWSFSARNSSDPYARFTWSAGTTASPVPEPASMLLFGAGLASLAGFAKRRKK